MSEQDNGGWKPSERMQRLAEKKGIVIPGMDVTEKKPNESVEIKSEIKVDQEKPAVEKTPEAGVTQTAEAAISSWDQEIALIEKIADPKMREDFRAEWIRDNYNNNSIPLSVRVEQLNILNQDSATPEGKKEKEVADNEKDKKENKMKDEDWKKIVDKCFDSVFGEEKKSTKQSILNESIWGFNGFFAVDLNKPKDTLVEGEVERCNIGIEKMKLDEWIGIRRVFDNWTAIKRTDDIKPSNLSKDLFIGQKSEIAFAHMVCDLPGNVEGTIEKNVNVGLKIGEAMKSLRLHFEQNETDDYWGYIGAEMKLREELYSNLTDENGNELNKYVCEAAFAFLISNQMLTDLSKDDNFSKLVRQDKTKVKKYTNAPAADATVRRLVYDNLREGGNIFKDPGIKKEDMETMVNLLEKVLPTQLVPTGLSGMFTSENLTEEEKNIYSRAGEYHLDKGDWLEWRSRNQYTKISVINDKERRKKEVEAIHLNNPEEQKKAIERLTRVGNANDPDSRLEMMKTALDVILVIKEVEDSKSDLSKLTDLNKKLISHLNGSLSDFNWLDSEIVFNSRKNKFEENQYINKEFGYRDGSEKMSLNDWKSRLMLTMEQTYLYVHSATDHLNQKPWNMFEFSKNVEELYSIDVQSGRTDYVGHEKYTRKDHWSTLLKYAQKIWNDTEKIAQTVTPVLGIFGANNTSRYPKWWSRGVPVNNDVIEAVNTVYSARGVWSSTQDRLTKSISRL